MIRKLKPTLSSHNPEVLVETDKENGWNETTCDFYYGPRDLKSP